MSLGYMNQARAGTPPGDDIAELACRLAGRYGLLAASAQQLIVIEGAGLRICRTLRAGLQPVTLGDLVLGTVLRGCGTGWGTCSAADLAEGGRAEAELLRMSTGQSPR